MTAPQTDIRNEVAALAAELRRLREQAGLSFAALGEQTPYSRSAWQRYLTAKVLPPWPAVRDLCRLAGEPEPRLRALWELAESAVRGRGAVTAEAPPESEPEPTTPPPVRNRRRVRIALAVALIATIAAAAVGDYLLRDTRGTPSRAATGSFTVTCTQGPCDPTCHGASCTGQDPGLTLCGIQARPLQQQETPNGIGLEVRYNPVCRAAWARFWNTHVGDSLTVTTAGQPTQTIRIATPQQANDFAYTPMIFVTGAGVTLRACVTPAGGTPDCYTSTAS